MVDNNPLILTPWGENHIAAVNWSPWHDRLHRHLLKERQLLPKGKALVLAVSGGQDSMAMLGLLRDLVRHHHWALYVWHGNHGWYAASQRSSGELKHWCQEQGLAFRNNAADPGTIQSEAAARLWRYQCLKQTAEALQADVLTAHTATDRTETLLLQMARGSDLRGLCSLRAQRPLQDKEPKGIQLNRPMLLFERNETAEICNTLQLPTWPDPTNTSPLFARNRIRNEVLPVLEELYPGCTKRISNLSERLSTTREVQEELLNQCFQNSANNNQSTRLLFKNSSSKLRRILINAWIAEQGAPQLNATQLEELSRRLGPKQPPGSAHLPKGWKINWSGETLALTPPLTTPPQALDEQ